MVPSYCCLVWLCCKIHAGTPMLMACTNIEIILVLFSGA